MKYNEMDIKIKKIDMEVFLIKNGLVSTYLYLLDCEASSHNLFK